MKAKYIIPTIVIVLGISVSAFFNYSNYQKYNDVSTQYAEASSNLEEVESAKEQLNSTVENYNTQLSSLQAELTQVSDELETTETTISDMDSAKDGIKNRQ